MAGRSIAQGNLEKELRAYMEPDPWNGTLSSKTTRLDSKEQQLPKDTPRPQLSAATVVSDLGHCSRGRT